MVDSKMRVPLKKWVFGGELRLIQTTITTGRIIIRAIRGDVVTLLRKDVLVFCQKKTSLLCFLDIKTQKLALVLKAIYR